jgi:DNA-binding XRE family transcriptional regulator
MRIKITDRGKLIHQLRRDLYELDIEMIANHVGVSKSTIYSIRSGRTKWPRDTTLLVLIHVLGYSLWLEK